MKRSGKTVQFLVKCKDLETISIDDWQIIKPVILAESEAFLKPPASILALAEGSRSKYLILAQYALSQNLNILPIEHVMLPILD